MEQIVYVETPISELPRANRLYTVVCHNSDKRISYWDGNKFDWNGLPRITHWYKPVQLSTLIKSEWVSVEERLPENNEKVLCYYYPRQPVMEGRIIGINYRREFDHLKGSIRHNLEYNRGFSEYVTHWQPLPPKP